MIRLFAAPSRVFATPLRIIAAPQVACVLLLAAAVACGNEPAPSASPVDTAAAGGQDAGSSDDATVHDGGSDDGSSAPLDAGSAGADSGGPDVATATGPACSATNPTGEPFDTTASGSDPWQKVSDFTVPTIDGPVSLSKLWTGCDSYVFVIHHPDPKYSAYAGAVWSSPPPVLFKEAPANTHWFFLSYDTNAKQQVTAQRDKYLDALLKLPAKDQAHWKPRLHFVTQRAWAAGPHSRADRTKRGSPLAPARTAPRPKGRRPAKPTAQGTARAAADALRSPARSAPTSATAAG